MANYYNMYNGNQPFNDTIHLNGPAPLDDREVFSSVEGLYFTHGEKNHPLFNRAYKGMQVVIFDGSASIFMILNDATPYSANNTTVNVTAQNYLDYWAILSGSEYKIVKADVANAGMISTYKLAFKSPNMKEFQTLEDTVIDIPKDYVLKEVHQCKASYNTSTNAYTETSYPNDSKWTTDKNPVYIHFIWQTKDSSTATSNTYLKVADVIKVDLTELNSSVNTLETHFKTVVDPSISALERHFINIVDPSVSALESHFDTVVDPSVSAVESHIANTIDPSISKIEKHINKDIDPSISSLERHFIDVVDPSISALETHFDTVVDPSISALESYIANTIDSSISALESHFDTVVDPSISAVESHISNTIDPSVSVLERHLIDVVDPSVSALETHFATVVDPSISVVESHIANVIDPSISSLERHLIDVVDPSVSALETHFATVVDPSVNKLENAVHDISIGNIKFTGGSTPDNVKTLTEHGMLPANTTIGYLETQTISDILKMILFETAVPKETQSNSATIKWKSGSKYASYVDVGDNYPTVDQIVQESKNAISKWASKDGTVTGGETNLNLYNSSVLYYSTNSTFDSSVDARTDYVYTDHKVTYGNNGYFCSVVDFKKGSDAVDSLGSTTNSEGTKYIAAYATKKKSTTLTLNGSYRYFSNANVVTTTDFNTNGTKSKEPSPATFRGSEDTNAQMSTFFASANKTFYLKWTSNYTKGTDKFYLYIPNNMSITSVGSANPMTTAYDGAVTYTQQGTASMNNGFASHTFKKYLINWDGGVLDLKVVVA